PKKLGRAVFQAVSELSLASIPGFFRINAEASKSASAVGVYRPALISRDLVSEQVHMVGGKTWQVSAKPPCTNRVSPWDAHDTATKATELRDGLSTETRQVPLGTVVGARSGDKGGNANIGVFVATDGAWEWIVRFLTVE